MNLLAHASEVSVALSASSRYRRAAPASRLSRTSRSIWSIPVDPAKLFLSCEAGHWHRDTLVEATVTAEQVISVVSLR